MTEKTEKVVYGNPITIKSSVYAVIFIVVAVLLSNLTHLYTPRGELFLGFLLPFFYLTWVNVLMGKISPKLKLNIYEMTLIVTVWFGIMGTQMTGDIHPHSHYLEATMHPVGLDLYNPTYKTYFAQWVPSYMFPKSDLAISAYNNALAPGQSLPWGEFVVPIVYWTTYVVLQFAFVWFLALGVWGKRFVDVENLPFTMTVPFLYSIEASYDVDERNKSRWFSLRSTGYKIFWVAFIVGVVMAAFPIIQLYIPAVSFGVIGADYGEVGVTLPFASLVPGARWSAVFMHDQWALWLLLPINTLATIVVQWFVIEVIWVGAAVQAGILPYQPGGAWLGRAYEYGYPFPYGVAWQGAWIGIGIITLWTLRGRFKELYNSLRGQDKTEYGLSTRLITIFGIIVTLALIGFFIGTGVPVIIALMIVGIAFITYTALAKLQSIFWLHDWDFVGGGVNVWWYTGAQLGYWPITPSIGTQTYAAFATVNMQQPFNYDYKFRCHGYSPGSVCGIYNIARVTKTNMKKLLIGAMLTIVLGTVVYYVSIIYLLSHGGGVFRTGMGTGIGTGKYNNGFFRVSATLTGSTTYAEYFPWQLLGMAIIFVTYIMRMKFSWFWLDPAAMAYSLPHMAWHWLVALTALIVKLVLIRVMGATRFNNYAKHMASGLVLGYCGPVLIAWLIDFYTGVIPNFQSVYVP